MPIVLVSLGANLGNSRTTINTAAAMLQDEFGAEHTKFSSLLSSPAVGGPIDQDDFFNAVAKLETSDSVFAVWHRLTKIETNLGRRRRMRWESRQIDLDILMYDDLKLWTPHLKVPHPRMITRSFAILPAAELIPDKVEPVSGWQLKQLANRLDYCYDPEELELLAPEHEKLVRKEVIVLCIGDDLRSEFERRFGANNSSLMSVRFVTAASLENASQLKSIVESSLTSDTMLIVLAVVCPDPMSIAWEDFSRQYAYWLNMASTEANFSLKNGDSQLTEQPDSWNLQMPKYLLNCYDIDWAIHELNAALTAMCCKISFAEPGWSFEQIT